MRILNYGDFKYEALQFYNTNVNKSKLHSLSVVRDHTVNWMRKYDTTLP